MTDAVTCGYPRTGDGIHLVSTTDSPPDQRVSTISTVSTIGWLEVIEIDKCVYRKESEVPSNGGYWRIPAGQSDIGDGYVSTKFHGRPGHDR